MKSLVKLSTLALVTVLTIPQSWSGPKVKANRTALYSTLAASLVWIVMKTFQPNTHSQLTLEPFKAKSVLKRFLLGHVAEVLEKGVWTAYMTWGSSTTNITPEERAAGENVARPTLIELVGGSPRFLITNAADAEFILVSSSPGAFKKGRGYELLRRFFGTGLFTQVDDKIHSAHRRILGPAFSPKSLKHLANTVVPQHTIDAVNELNQLATKHEEQNDGAPLVQDLQPFLDNLAFGIIAQVAFKTVSKSSAGEATNIREIFSAGLKATFSPVRMSRMVEKAQIRNNRIVAEKREEILKIVSAIVKQVRGENSESSVNEERADALIDYLVHSKAFTEQEISDHSMVFLFAGFDTTSSALGWAIYLLAKYPEVQEKLFEEVSSCVGHGQSATLDALRDCKFLTAVCKETLRLYPPAHMVVRSAVCDNVLPGSKTFVPAGTGCLCSVAVLHRSPKYWGEDADDFKPERWEEPGFDEKVNGFCFMPFSLGKRNCIGKEFAMNEFVLVMSVVARNFELRLPKGAPEPKPDATLIVRPIEPIQMEVHKRTA